MGVILGVALMILFILSIGLCVKGFYDENKKFCIISYVLMPIFLITFIFVPFGFKQISTGEIAVAKVWGEAKSVETAGLKFRNIISTKYEIYDIKTQQVDIETQAYSADAQTLTVNLSTQFSINVEKVLEINRTFGSLEILKNRIEKVTNEKVKVLLASKSAMTIIETRASLSPTLFTSMKELESQYFITIENVVVVDISFNAAFEQAVEQKMIAEQEKLKATYDMEKAIIKANELLAVAKLEAEANIEMSKGDAEALKIMQQAWGSLAADVKEAMLRQLAIEKWDGKLPETMVGDDFLRQLLGSI